MKNFKRMITMAIAIGMAACALFSGCGGGGNDPYADVDKSFLNGIDEPIASDDVQVKGFDVDITIDLIKMLGCKTVRFRLPFSLMSTPESVNEAKLEEVKSILGRIIAAGISPVGQYSIFPAYTSFRPDSYSSVPRPDDPAYVEWMEALSDMWEKAASLFPEITYWEMGNEFNSNTFFHPNGYQAVSGSLQEGTNGFKYEEQVVAVTDYMYYATQGMHRGNPNARSVMPGLSPLNNSFIAVENFIYDVYDRVKSGQAPCGSVKSTEPDDYFEVLCWHPYIDGTLDEGWLNAQNRIYQAAIDNGDEGKKVFFTEFGFSDDGIEDLEEAQIGYFERAYGYCKNDMPYVERLFAFRLYQCSYAATWGGSREDHYGYFTEPDGVHGFGPKQKALSLQRLYGGVGDLYKYYNV